MASELLYSFEPDSAYELYGYKVDGQVDYEAIFFVDRARNSIRVMRRNEGAEWNFGESALVNGATPFGISSNGSGVYFTDSLGNLKAGSAASQITDDALIFVEDKFQPVNPTSQLAIRRFINGTLEGEEALVWAENNVIKRVDVSFENNKIKTTLKAKDEIGQIGGIAVENGFTGTKKIHPEEGPEVKVKDGKVELYGEFWDWPDGFRGPFDARYHWTYLFTVQAEGAARFSSKEWPFDLQGEIPITINSTGASTRSFYRTILEAGTNHNYYQHQFIIVDKDCNGIEDQFE